MMICIAKVLCLRQMLPRLICFINRSGACSFVSSLNCGIILSVFFEHV